jgi:protein arginine kinase
LARNIRPYSFPGWLKKQERLELLEKIQQAVLGIPEMQEAFLNETMDHFTPLQKQLLVEQHLISREHAAKNAGSGIVISKDKTLSFMLNEEDHLRLQSIRIGFDLTEAWKTIDRVDTELENNLEFAFSANIGYLTACPTNVGTGMRASVMLHLPGLVLSDQINQVIKSVNQIGLAVRGLYGEGTEALGNLFQISNQMTLGESEKQIIDKLTKVINQIVEHEKNARQKLVQEKSRMLADQLGRAFGVLNFAHSISSKEALNLLSLIRLGIEIGVFPQSYRHKVDALFIDTQPAHLQHASKKKLSADERDSFRADLLRERLKSMPDPSMKHLQL